MVGFNSSGQFRLLKGVSYSAPRDSTIRLFGKGDADSWTQRCLCPWLLASLVIVFFHAESPASAERNSGFSCPVIVIFLGEAGAQLMRQLRMSSVSVEGLRAVPVVCFHW